MAAETYEVLSPWADVDPASDKGISPRVTDLAGKTIGLYCNDKRAAEPVMNVVEKQLKQRYVGIRISRFANLRPNLPIVEQKEGASRFEKWLDSVDTVITAYGD